MIRRVLVVTLALMATGPCARLFAQTYGTCVPVSERGGRAFGCFITAREPMVDLPKGPLFWYLDTYPTRAAADVAKGLRGTVVESLDKVWLFTIAEAGKQPAGKERVAVIGPLPLVAADEYLAVYMEGVFEPGMVTVVHRHPGVEAWFTLDGVMCVETPEGKQVQSAGDPGLFVTEGTPMQLTGIGTAVRRSLVLILQDASKPLFTHAGDWTPSGLCRR